MTQRDQKIARTLELLVMLSRSKQQFSHDQSDEEKATLRISRQLIADAGLTVPEFTNSVHTIAEKGYIWHVVIFDKELRSQMDNFINSDQYAQVFEQLKVMDTKETSDKLKQSTAEQLTKILPHGVELDQKELDNDHINFSEAFADGIQAFRRMSLNEIALVILMPFRDINTLLEKMNNDQSFDDIIDDGFWFDVENYTFYIDGEPVKTIYNNKPNKEHFVLEQLFKHPSYKKVYYEDLTAFEQSADESKENASFRDACKRFIDKHHRLSSLFTAHIDHLEFHPE